MKILNTRNFDNFTIFEVKLDSDKWKDLFSNTKKDLFKNLEIPGFRKSHVPSNKFNEIYPTEKIVQEVLDKNKQIILNVLAKTPEYKKSKCLETLRGFEILKFNGKKAPIIKVSFDALPVVSGFGTEDVKKLEISKFKSGKYSDKFINEQVKEFVRKDAKIYLKRNGIVSTHSIVTIDFQGFKDGVALKNLQGKKFELEIGSNKLASNFEKQLIGLNRGKTKEIFVTFPKNYEDKNLSGFKIKFNVTINEVKTIKYPTVNKDYLRKHGITRGEGKNAIAKYIKNMYKEQDRLSYNVAAMKVIKTTIAKKATLSYYPNLLLEQYKDIALNDFKDEISQQGFKNVKDYKKTLGLEEDSYQEVLTNSAKTLMLIALCFDQLIEDYKLRVEPKDLKTYFKKIVKSYSSKEEAKQAMVDNKVSIEKEILNAKLFEILIAKGKKPNKKVKAKKPKQKLVNIEFKKPKAKVVVKVEQKKPEPKQVAKVEQKKPVSNKPVSGRRIFPTEKPTLAAPTMMKKHRKINIVMPIIGAAALLGGAALVATSLTLKKQSEADLPHDISLFQPTDPKTSGWKLTCDKLKAKKGDTVVFTVEKKTVSNAKKYPTGIRINQSAVYQLTPNGELYTASVQIGFIEKMTADIVFEDEVTNKYTVTFDTMGGSNVDAQLIDENEFVTKPENPKREGYTFSKWMNDGKEFDFNTPINKNIILKASWNINNYTVTWKNDDGTVLKTDTVQYGQLPSYAGATPTKKATGEKTYIFSGWGKIETVKGDVTYTAHYEEITNKYVVYFNTDGVGSIDPCITEYNQTISMPKPAEEMVREGYTFDGWLKPDNTKWNFATDKVTSDITLKANWIIKTFTVTWKNYDGSTLEIDNNVKYGELPSYNGATPTKPSSEGKIYTFNGWGEALEPVKANKTYTANYADTTNKYSVQFDSDGGEYVTPLVVAHGTKLSKPSITDKEGHTLTGWFNGETQWNFDTDTVQGNITLKAVWSVNKYTVTWMNGTQELQKDTLEYGTIPSYNGSTPTKTKTQQYTYTFKGWDKTIDVVKADTIYNAEFIETTNQYVVQFNSNGGTYAEPKVANYGSTITAPTEPTKPGYTFDGWYNGETKWNFTTSQVLDNVTLTAKWIPTYYTVKWVNYDGTQLEKDENVEYGTIPSYDGETPTKKVEGLVSTFKGWDQAITPVTKDITYKAEFLDVAQKVSVTFNSNGGSTITPLTIDVNSKLEKNKYVPTLANYSLVGWYKDSALTQQWDFDNDKVTTNITLYAKWKPSVTVAYDKSTDLTYNSSLGGWTLKITNATTDNLVSIPEGNVEGPDGSSYPIVEVGSLNNSSIIEVYLPSSVKKISESAFSNCQSLKKINLDNITEMESYSFAYCTKLKEVNLTSLESCSKYAVFDNSGLKTIYGLNCDYNSMIKLFGEYYGTCTNIQKIVFGKNATTDLITNIRQNITYNYTSLKYLDVDKSNPNIEAANVENGSAIIRKSDKALLLLGVSSNVIPSGVGIILENTFNNSNITSITIPATVTEIQSNAFNGCYYLSTISFEKSATTAQCVLKQYAIQSCPVTKLVLNNVKTIESYAISYLSDLQEISFPDLEGIYPEYGLVDSYYNLTKIDFTGNNKITELASWAFTYLKSDCVITLSNSITKLNSYCIDNSNNSLIIYNGTMAEFDAIHKDDYWWNSDASTKTVRCTDGDITIS